MPGLGQTSGAPLVPVALATVQAIQGATGPPLPSTASCGQAPAGVKPVRLWYSGNCSYGPSARSVGAGYQSPCPGQIPLVSTTVECPPAQPATPPTDDEQCSIDIVTSGVIRALRDAPLLVVDQAPWVAPSYRGRRYPINDVQVISTFGAADARTIWAQDALASYLTTINYAVPTVQLTAGATTTVLAWQAYSAWTGDELVVSCCDQEALYLVQWSVCVNGLSVCGPFSLIGDRFPINVQALRNDNVSVNATLAATDSFAMGVEILLNGWMHPSLSRTDGTFHKILRASPGWPRNRN